MVFRKKHFGKVLQTLVKMTKNTQILGYESLFKLVYPSELLSGLQTCAAESEGSARVFPLPSTGWYRGRISSGQRR